MPGPKTKTIIPRVSKLKLPKTLEETKTYFREKYPKSKGFVYFSLLKKGKKRFRSRINGYTTSFLTLEGLLKDADRNLSIGWGD